MSGQTVTVRFSIDNAPALKSMAEVEVAVDRLLGKIEIARAQIAKLADEYRQLGGIGDPP